MSIQLRPFFGCVAFSLIFASGIGTVMAGEKGEKGGRYVPLLPKYQQECAACHIPYSPTLMPAASWRRLMGNLPNHFGTDASLDPATLKELSAWINANAGTYKRVREEPPQDRITRTEWFIRKHDEVPAAAWKLPLVKSASNCTACHTTAEQGDFNERSIRIPR